MDTTSLTIDRNENLRFTLRDLFILVTLIAVIFATGRSTGTYAMSVHLTMLVIGWIMHRFIHAHLGGLIPCLFGLDYLTIRAIDWVYYGGEGPFIFDEILNMFASFLIGVGAVVFLFLSVGKGQHARSQLKNAVVFIAILAAWWVIVPVAGSVAVGNRQTRDAAFNSAAMNKAVTDVEALRQKLGRIPREADLKDHVKDGLPKIRSGSGERAISYNHVSDQEYHLWCLISSGDLWGDIHYYDSDQPQKGWQVEPF